MKYGKMSGTKKSSAKKCKKHGKANCKSCKKR